MKSSERPTEDSRAHECRQSSARILSSEHPTNDIRTCECRQPSARTCGRALDWRQLSTRLMTAERTNAVSQAHECCHPSTRLKARLHMRFLMRFLVRFRVQNAPYSTLHEYFFHEASRGLERKLSHIISRHPSFQFLLIWRYFVAELRDYKPVRGRLWQVLFAKSHRNRMKNRMCKRALMTSERMHDVSRERHGKFIHVPCERVKEAKLGATYVRRTSRRPSVALLSFGSLKSNQMILEQKYTERQQFKKCSREYRDPRSTRWSFEKKKCVPPKNWNQRI